MLGKKRGRHERFMAVGGTAICCLPEINSQIVLLQTQQYNQKHLNKMEERICYKPYDTTGTFFEGYAIESIYVPTDASGNIHMHRSTWKYYTVIGVVINGQLEYDYKNVSQKYNDNQHCRLRLRESEGGEEYKDITVNSVLCGYIRFFYKGEAQSVKGFKI